MYNFTTSKKILYYTSRYNQKDWGIGEGNTPFESQVCSVQNCYLTTDKNLLGKNQIEKFDALLFHLSGIQPNVLNTLPKRDPTQRYIFSAPGPPIGEKYNRQEKMRYMFILQRWCRFINYNYWIHISDIFSIGQWHIKVRVICRHQQPMF